MEFPLPSERILPENIPLTPPRPISEKKDVDRFIGSLVGLAVGDALGASVEFRPHQYFVEHPVVDMEGGGTWGLAAGQWTDDTSMALCLGSSLISKNGYDPYDQMIRYKWWYKSGYLSSTGHCFDIGNATRDSLDEFIRRQKILQKYFKGIEPDELLWKEIQSKMNFDVNCSRDGVAGNGALMRLAPIPLFFYRYPAMAVEYAGRSACLTHGDKKAVDACRYYAALIVAAVCGEPKEKILSNDFYESHRQWFGSVSLHPEILRVAHGSYQNSKGYDGGIRGKGYIVSALEAALWAFWSDGDSFSKGALNAVNLGDDTDTTAAIYGQLAGAFYGSQKILNKWRRKLYAYNLIECVGQWLYSKGLDYNLTEKEREMLLGGQSSNITSSIEKQTTQTRPSPIHSSVHNPPQANLEGNREFTTDQSVPHNIPVDHRNVNRLSISRPNETQPYQRNRENHGVSQNTFNTSQQRLRQQSQRQLPTPYADHYPISTRRPDGANNLSNNTSYSYGTGHLGQYPSAYDHIAEDGNTRRNNAHRDPYYHANSITHSNSVYPQDTLNPSRTIYTNSSCSSSYGTTNQHDRYHTYRNNHSNK